MSKIFSPLGTWTSNFKRTPAPPSPPSHTHTHTPSPTNYGTVTPPCMWTNKIETKAKPSHATFKLTTCSIDRFSPQTMPWHHEGMALLCDFTLTSNFCLKNLWNECHICIPPYFIAKVIGDIFTNVPSWRYFIICTKLVNLIISTLTRNLAVKFIVHMSLALWIKSQMCILMFLKKVFRHSLFGYVISKSLKAVFFI